MGYARAGFDVTGVDAHRMPRYPFRFIHADAMTYPLDGFDVIHASPPCQLHSAGTRALDIDYPDLIAPTRERLKVWGGPYVIENVEGAPLINPITMCGAQHRAFDPATGLTLRLRRHRLFESNLPLMAEPCSCDSTPVGGVYGGASTTLERARTVRHGGYTPSRKVQETLMGIDWMSRAELNQAIPPAYTQWIGEQALLSIPCGTPSKP
jgi:DNA (cytosine-5)-methyltransferase 1